MFIFTGVINRTRKVNFKTGPATFLEVIAEYTDRAAQAYEIKLPDEMELAQFERGATVSIALVPNAGKTGRLYLSALRNQPEGYPKITHS